MLSLALLTWVSSTTDTGNLDFGRTQQTDGGTYTVTWAPSTDPIVLSESFSISLTATPDVMPEGGFVYGTVGATMPNHGHGMNVSPVVSDNGDGTATAEPFQFHMEGWWEITVELVSAEGSEVAAFNYYCCD